MTETNDDQGQEQKPRTKPQEKGQVAISVRDALPPGVRPPPTRGPRVFRVASGVRLQRGNQVLPEGAKVLLQDGEPNPLPTEPLVFDAEATRRQVEEQVRKNRKGGAKPPK